MMRIVVGIILIIVGAFYFLAPRKVLQMKTGEKDPKPSSLKTAKIGGIITVALGVFFVIFGILTI